MSKKRKKHACWSCETKFFRSSFSLVGPHRWICEACQNLGDVEYRWAQRELNLCVLGEGLIPRKSRRRFERVLRNPNLSVQELALQYQQRDKLAREQILARHGKTLRRRQEADVMPEATPDDWEEMQEMLDSPYDSDSPEWVQNFEPRPTCPSWLLEGDIDPSFFGLNDEETLEEIVEYTGRRFPWRLLPAAGDC